MADSASAVTACAHQQACDDDDADDQLGVLLAALLLHADHAVMLMVVRKRLEVEILPSVWVAVPVLRRLLPRLLGVARLLIRGVLICLLAVWLLRARRCLPAHVGGTVGLLPICLVRARMLSVVLHNTPDLPVTTRGKCITRSVGGGHMHAKPR